MHVDSTIQNAISILRKGGVIIHPTDTIYGIACDIQCQEAVERIYAAKKRDRSKPLILLVSSLDMLKEYIQNIHPRIETLLVHHKRPLTVIYEANRNVPPYLLGPSRTIAIRLIHHELSRSIIETLGRPITSTSANISGSPFPKYEADIEKALRNQVDMLIPNLEPSGSTNEPSLVIKYDDEGQIEVLRS